MAVDVFVNCIYLTDKIPYFLTPSFINGAGVNRRLSVIVDVSCDATNPNNPIPVYGSLSAFNKPVVKALTECVTTLKTFLQAVTLNFFLA